MMKKYRNVILYYLIMVFIMILMGITSLRMIYQVTYQRMVNEREQELTNFGINYNEKIDQLTQTINDLYYFPDIVWTITKSTYEPQDYLRLKSIEKLIHMTSLQNNWVAGYCIYFTNSHLVIDQSRIYMSLEEAYPDFIQVDQDSQETFIQKYILSDDGFYPEAVLNMDGKEKRVIPYTQRVNLSNGMVVIVFLDVDKMEEELGISGTMYSVEYRGTTLCSRLPAGTDHPDALFLSSQKDEYGLSFHTTILDHDLRTMQWVLIQRYLLILFVVTVAGILALMGADYHFNRSVRKMAGEYENQKLAIHRYYMNRLLDTLSSDHEVEKAGDFFGINQQYDSMAATVVSNDDKIDQTVKELLEGCPYSYVYMVRKGYRAEIIFYNLADPKLVTDDMEKRIMKIQNQMENGEKRPWIAFGNPYKPLHGIAVSWMEAKKTMKYCQKYPENDVFCYHQLPMSRDIVALDVEAKKKMQMLITSGEIQKAQQQFLELYEKQYGKELILNPVMANNFTAQIANVFLYAIETTITDSNKKEALMLQVAYLFSEQDSSGLKQQILTLIEKIGACSKQSEEDQNRQIKKILEYINQNYQNPDLSLQQMGELFHMNYGYFSQYFKQHTGKNFSQYLENIRMEKAIELLGDEASVTETMEQVGYLNRNTFYKAFTRVHGLSPKAYKEWKQKQPS